MLGTPLPPHFINVVICFVFCIHVNQDQLHHCYSFLLKYFSSFTFYSSNGVISIRDIQRAVVVQIYYYHDWSTSITGVDAAFLWTDGNDTKGESNNSDFHILSDTLSGSKYHEFPINNFLHDYMYMHYLFLLIGTEPTIIVICIFNPYNWMSGFRNSTVLHIAGRNHNYHFTPIVHI